MIGALFIVLRGNFKRLFAYSSVEHMGIIAIALGFGGVLGLYGALLHTLTHAIGKAVLFLTSGDVVLRYRTRVAAECPRAAESRSRSPARCCCSARSRSLGSPPFGLFLCEFTIVRAGLRRVQRGAAAAAARPARDRVHRVRPDHHRHGDRARGGPHRPALASGSADTPGAR